MSDGRACGVQADLDLLEQLMRELDGLASCPPQSVRPYSFSIRWGTMLAGRLQRVAYYSAREQLSAAQAAQWAQLRRRLRDLEPTLARLRLARPRLDAAFDQEA